MPFFNAPTFRTSKIDFKQAEVDADKFLGASLLTNQGVAQALNSTKTKMEIEGYDVVTMRDSNGKQVKFVKYLPPKKLLEEFPIRKLTEEEQEELKKAWENTCSQYGSMRNNNILNKKRLKILEKRINKDASGNKVKYVRNIATKQWYVLKKEKLSKDSKIDVAINEFEYQAKKESIEHYIEAKWLNFLTIEDYISELKEQEYLSDTELINKILKLSADIIQIVLQLDKQYDLSRCTIRLENFLISPTGNVQLANLSLDLLKPVVEGKKTSDLGNLFSNLLNISIENNKKNIDNYLRFEVRNFYETMKNELSKKDIPFRQWLTYFKKNLLTFHLNITEKFKNTGFLNVAEFAGADVTTKVNLIAALREFDEVCLIDASGQYPAVEQELKEALIRLYPEIFYPIKNAGNPNLLVDPKVIRDIRSYINAKDEENIRSFHYVTVNQIKPCVQRQELWQIGIIKIEKNKTQEFYKYEIKQHLKNLLFNEEQFNKIKRDLSYEIERLIKKYGCAVNAEAIKKLRAVTVTGKYKDEEKNKKSAEIIAKMYSKSVIVDNLLKEIPLQSTLTQQSLKIEELKSLTKDKLANERIGYILATLNKMNKFVNSEKGLTHHHAITLLKALEEKVAKTAIIRKPKKLEEIPGFVVQKIRQALNRKLRPPETTKRIADAIEFVEHKQRQARR